MSSTALAALVVDQEQLEHGLIVARGAGRTNNEPSDRVVANDTRIFATSVRRDLVSGVDYCGRLAESRSSVTIS